MKTELNEVMEAMDASRNDENVYFDRTTGRFVYLMGENDSAKEEGHDYLLMPSREELNDYRAMEEFVNTVEDDDTREWLANAMKGKGAFRRFRGACDRFHILDDWYDWLDAFHRDQAIQWCEDNGILYEEEIIRDTQEFDWNDEDQFTVQEEIPEYRHEPIRIVPITSRNSSSVILLIQNFRHSQDLDRCMQEIEARTQAQESIYALCDEGRMTGIIAGHLEKDKMLCDMLYIDPPYRHRGYGRKLVARLAEEGKLSFATQEQDTAGRAFLAAIGYGTVKCVIVTE